MKKFAAISISIFLFLSFVLNVPFFSYIFTTEYTYKTINTYHGVYPVINASRFTECVIDSLEVCSNSDFYKDKAAYDEIHKFAYSLYPYDSSANFLSYLFEETLSDLGFPLVDYPDEFFLYVFELAVVKYYNPYEYYILLETYGVRDVVGGIND